MNIRICGFRVISFNCSINQFLEYCNLANVIATRLFTHFTFVLQKISKRKLEIIFCYTEVLFSRHSESNRTHIFLEEAVQILQKLSFYEYSGKNSQEGKFSSPKSRQSSRKKMYVMNSILFSVKSVKSVLCCGLRMCRLFSVALLGCFCCANKATQPEADKQKKANGFIC